MLINGYTDLSLSETGARSHSFVGSRFSAHFILDTDISVLFPYVNAVNKSVYHDKPRYIQFVFEGFNCILYPEEIIISPVNNKEHALDFITTLIDYLNGIYKRREQIQPSYKTQNTVSVVDIIKLLPGTNCKVCGYQTCLAFAAALSKEKANNDLCPELTRPIFQKAVYPVYDDDGNVSSSFEMYTKGPKNEPSIQYCSNKRQKETGYQITTTVKKKGNYKESKRISPNKDALKISLTDRELEVLRLISKGATNNEISQLLSISPHTVKSHIINIFNKVGVNDRTQAAVWAARHEVI